jgi:hypothetical protein
MAKQKVGTQRGHQTQWAAQFAVASELCKRGYEVSFTMGNTTPVADLMVVSPVKREMFLVDVKGLYRLNPWIIKRKSPRAMLFYVLAFVPANAPNEFFVLRQQDADNLIRKELRRLKRPANYSMTGFLWKLANPFRNAWDVLPA